MINYLIRNRIITLVVFFLGLITWQVQAEESLPKLVKKIQPAVLTIMVYDAQGQPKGLGSGFFISNKDQFITNYHVLAGASRVEAKTYDGLRYPIKALAVEDRSGDLVVAVIDRSRGISAGGKKEDRAPVYPYLEISRIMPEVGERVVVVGSPMGLEQTLSDGLISAIRSVEGMGEVLQITAPISPGSSGGPVINLKGEVIGVATFQMQQGQNLNFAIPGRRALTLLQGVPGKPTDHGRLRGSDEKTSPRQGESRLEDPTAMKFYAAGYSLLKEKKFAEAADNFKQAIKIQPDNASAYSGLGLAFGMLGRYKESAEASKQAIRLKPDFFEAYLNLGEAYARDRRYKEAAEAIKQAIRLKPDDAQAHYDLGLVFLSIGNKQGAREEHRILQNLDPKLASNLFKAISK